MESSDQKKIKNKKGGKIKKQYPLKNLKLERKYKLKKGEMLSKMSKIGAPTTMVRRA